MYLGSNPMSFIPVEGFLRGSFSGTGIKKILKTCVYEGLVFFRKTEHFWEK